MYLGLCGGKSSTWGPEDPHLGLAWSWGPLSKVVPTQFSQLSAYIVVTLDSLIHTPGLSFLSSMALLSLTLAVP